MQLSVEIENLRLRTPLRISDRVFETVEALVATVTLGGVQGRGEAQGIYYRGETAASIGAQIAELNLCGDDILTRDSLQTMLPAGGARNALDCAL